MRIRIVCLALSLVVATGIQAQDKQLQAPEDSKELNKRTYIQLLRADLKTQKEALIKEANPPGKMREVR